MSLERNFRRRVLSLSLATTLVFGAFGSPIYASTKSDNYITKVSEMYDDAFEDKTDVNLFREKFNHYLSVYNTYQNELPFSDTIEGWFTIGEVPKKEIIENHLSAALGEPTTALDFYEGFIDILVPNSGETFATDVNNFRNDYKDQFHAIFGSNVTVDDFIDFLDALEVELKKPSTWSNALNSNSRLTSDLIDAATKEAVENLTTGEGDFVELDQYLTEGLGIGLNDIIEIRKNILSDFNLDHAQYYTPVKEALFEYALQQYLSAQPPADNGNGNGNGSGSGSGNGTGTGSTSPSESSSTKVITTPKVTVTIEKTANGVEVSVVKLDKEDLKKKLAENKDAKAIVISAGNNNGNTKAKLSLQDIADVIANNANNSFIVQAKGAEYSLPANLVSQSNLISKLGLSSTEASNAEVEINITEVPASGVNAGKGKLASKVVDFSIVVKSGDKSLELNNFGNTYIDRAIDLTESASSTKTVGVVVNADGSVSPVPTQFVEANGKKVAVLKRNANSAYTVISNDVALSDIQNHWAKNDIQLLADKLIANGYQDGTFKPQNNVTRAEFAALIARSLGFSTTDAEVNKFTDVSAKDWFAGAVKATVDAGLVTGYEDGSFRGNNKITRQEASVMITRAIEFLQARGDITDEKAATALGAFHDANSIANYAKESIGVATSLGIIKGDNKGNFKPLANTTRAETIVMLERLLDEVNFLSK